MGFWDGESCEYCAGKIEERRVEIYRKVGNSYVIVKNVPAGVCQECGTKYYAANVLKLLSRKVKERNKARKKIEVPVLSFSS